MLVIAGCTASLGRNVLHEVNLYDLLYRLDRGPAHNRDSGYWVLLHCDAHLLVSGLVWLEARLLVCCRVRDRDSVLNHGASSSSEDTQRIVSRGSPATIGRGGTERPSCNIRILTSLSCHEVTSARLTLDCIRREILAMCGTKSVWTGPLLLMTWVMSDSTLPGSPSLTKAQRYIWNWGSETAGSATAWSSSLHTPRLTARAAGCAAVLCSPSPELLAVAAATQLVSSWDRRARCALAMGNNVIGEVTNQFLNQTY